MTSEMSCCTSCTGIIDDFNAANRAAKSTNRDIIFNYGVYFNE